MAVIVMMMMINFNYLYMVKLCYIIAEWEHDQQTESEFSLKVI